MADFGTYKGHEILSNAMNNTLDRVTATAKMKENKRQFNAQMDQRKEEHANIVANDELARDRSQLQYDIDMEDNYTNQLKDEVLRNIYSDIGGVQPLITSPDGELIVNPDYEDIMRNWEDKHDFGSIMRLSDSLSGEYGGVKLDMNDINSIANNPDYGKHNYAQLKKQFAGMTEQEIDTFMTNNAGFATMMERYGIDQAAPKREGQTWGEYFSPSGDGADASIDEMIMAGGKGWTDEWSTEVEEASGWSGEIQFKSSIAPDKKSMKQHKILLEAVKQMKQNEEGFDVSDDVFLEHGNTGWRIIEDDMGHNDSYDIIWKDGVPMINYDGKNVAINKLTDFWD